MQRVEGSQPRVAAGPVPARPARPRSQAATPRDRYVPQGRDPHAETDRRLREARFLPRLDEEAEARILGGRNRPGQMVQLAQGAPGAGTTLTIHGINASPADVQGLSEHAAGQGHTVHTFAYDDRFRRLEDSSADLATQLSRWMTDNPGQPLRIRAHSMGGRVALAALGQLNEEGRLTNRVTLDLIAPPLGGFGVANWARTDFLDVLGPHVGGVRPGRDMGTTSGFQERLEQIQIPGVVTRIFLGEQDRMVDPRMPGFQAVAGRMRASQDYLPGDHVSVLEQVTRLQ